MHLVNECNTQHNTHANDADEERDKTSSIRLGELACSQKNVADEKVTKSPKNIYERG